MTEWTERGDTDREQLEKEDRPGGGTDRGHYGNTEIKVKDQIEEAEKQGKQKVCTQRGGRVGQEGRGSKSEKVGGSHGAEKESEQKHPENDGNKDEPKEKWGGQGTGGEENNPAQEKPSGLECGGDEHKGTVNEDRKYQGKEREHGKKTEGGVGRQTETDRNNLNQKEIVETDVKKKEKDGWVKEKESSGEGKKQVNVKRDMQRDTGGKEKHEQIYGKEERLEGKDEKDKETFEKQKPIGVKTDKKIKIDGKEEKQKETAMKQVDGKEKQEEIYGKEERLEGKDGKEKETFEKQKSDKQIKIDGKEEKQKETDGKGQKQKKTDGKVEQKGSILTVTGQEKQLEKDEGQVQQRETLTGEVKKKMTEGENMNQMEKFEQWKTEQNQKTKNEKDGEIEKIKYIEKHQGTQEEVTNEQQKYCGTEVEEKNNNPLKGQFKDTDHKQPACVLLVSKEPDTNQGWLELCDREWGLRANQVLCPENTNWRDIHKKKPFSRNLLRSPNPEGLSTSLLPPQEQFDPPPQKKPLETLGDFRGWKISTEEIPVEDNKVPPGVVVCYLPKYSWCVKEQLVDLLEEGLWAELLDVYQPHIYILDWYEDSKLHKHVYELHVKLLAEDKKTVIVQHDFTPENDMCGDPKGWNSVSHIFKSYGSGVRYAHFLHKSKDLSVLGYHRTRVADSSLFVNLIH